MRNLTVSILVTLAVLLGSAGESFALPECPGTHNANTWTNCEGTFTTADGRKYVGEFKDGKRHGQGTLTYADGNKYVGEWKDGKRHGQGTYTGTDRAAIKGVWENDKFKKFSPAVTTKKPSTASSYCRTPNIESLFMEDWHVGKIHYYKDSHLGFLIGFTGAAAKVTLYIYDFDLPKINQEDVDRQLQLSVHDMMDRFEKLDRVASLSKPMLVPKALFSKLDNLIDNAVYVVVPMLPSDELSIVSIGFYGKCFQKIRFTAKISSTDYKDVTDGLMVFSHFSNTLYNQLLNMGYYE